MVNRPKSETDEWKRLIALAGFAERFGEPGATFGEMSRGTERNRPGDAIQLPFWSASPLASQFVDMAYDTGWVLEDFDWPSWLESDEAQFLLAEPSGIASATVDQLRKLLTALIRQDRYCEGALLASFEDGPLRLIVTRARELIAQTH